MPTRAMSRFTILGIFRFTMWPIKRPARNFMVVALRPVQPILHGVFQLVVKIAYMKNHLMENYTQFMLRVIQILRMQFILVMKKGRIVEEYDAGAITEEEVGFRAISE